MTNNFPNFFIGTVILLFVLLESVQSDVINSEGKALHRLPKNISPTNYELWLYPHLKLSNFTYEGRVIISISVLSNTNSITLNAEGLNIFQERSELFHGNNSIDILSQNLDDERQFYIISLAVTIPPGIYSLRLNFLGEIRDDVFGFYRSAIKVGTKTRWMGVTQFSPTFARAAFPCFDEPHFKATFQLHLGHYNDERVTSNTFPFMDTPTEIENYTLTTMLRTPRMSTYLFCWSIHNFEYDSPPNISFFGIWTRKSMYGKGNQALEKGLRLYSALQSWTNISNSIGKMVHLTVPDFHFSAMENWGMITFRESVLLHGENITPSTIIHGGLTTMAHEYAHTWFGNLVTPEFWTIAWLKEGFATYFAYLARSLVDTDLKAMNLFVVENLESALLEDSGKHLRTMNGKDASENSSSLSIMDFVPYKKGSSVIRMIAELMGLKGFQMAMRSYLKDRLYDVGTPSILYQYLQKYPEDLVTPINFEAVIESYANQPGYPLITLTRNYSLNSLSISQQPFYQNPDYAYRKASMWWVPLSLMTQYGTRVFRFGSIWLKNNQLTITMNSDGIGIGEWIICDSDKAGYYRVNYDERNWNMLTAQLMSGGFDRIGSVARATLLDDAFNLARGGYINYSVPFHLARYLIDEVEYEPWLAATSSLDFLNKNFQDLPVLRDSLQDYVRRLLAPIYQSVTLTASNRNSLREKLLRQLIQSTACTMKNEHCLNTANLLFTKWIANSSQRIDAEMKSSVYCVGIRSGNEWDLVFRRFLNEDLHTEKEVLISGLGCTNNSASITRYLDFMISDAPQLPKQYRLKILDSVLTGDPENVKKALLHLSKNLQKIITMRGYPFLNKMITAIAGRITSFANLQMFLSIVDNNAGLLKPSEDKVKKATADIQANLSWIRKYSTTIENTTVNML
ncbi:membrane alanyl aminopeptidase-like [Diachasmimorpha longicaudata]|uniref:membrane alanyl aminopeptidase-like n=1 Tax=Diachasmimorpha longicaudata TaxID=58733 RepID=UPI0030B8890F